MKSITLIKKIKIDYSPEELFPLFSDDNSPFFLDSVTGRERLGQYSFIGSNPFMRFTSRGNFIEITANGNRKAFKGNPFNVLKDLMAGYKTADNNAAVPFVSGAVGYFSYNMGRVLEKLPSLKPSGIDNDSCLSFYDSMVAFDHIRNNCYLTAAAFGEENNGLKQAAEMKLKVLEDKIKNYKLPFKANLEKKQRAKIKSDFNKAEYLKAVKTAKEYIACGDIYQVNLAQRFTGQNSIKGFDLYKKLRKANPAPFGAYLKTGDLHILSSSPERFLKIKGKNVETRPIKGTRPRGENTADDIKLGEELLNSDKDNAELVMIVDLERNDLGKVCNYGSVRVAELKILEKYATVSHLVATVVGELHKNKESLDCLKACFPGGSITGAPKIRAMEIINDLEPVARDIYTGSIGYLDFNGDMDLNIAIRTIIINKNKVSYHVGGGIVADSDPEKEYEETLHKGKALWEVLTGRK